MPYIRLNDGTDREMWIGEPMFGEAEEEYSARPVCCSWYELSNQRVQEPALQS